MTPTAEALSLADTVQTCTVEQANRLDQIFDTSEESMYLAALMLGRMYKAEGCNDLARRVLNVAAGAPDARMRAQVAAELSGIPTAPAPSRQ